MPRGTKAGSTKARIYHHIWLTKTNPVHVAHRSTYVSSSVEGSSANISAETTLKNEGEGAKLRSVLTPDRKTINADGQDVSVIDVSVLDDKGRAVPIASNLVKFEISGGGKIIG